MKKLISYMVLSIIIMSFFPISASAQSLAFKDLYFADPSKDAITYLKDEAVVEGYADGTFKSQDKINRAEFLKIVVGSLSQFDVNTEKGANCFPDVKDDWYAKYVCFAKNKKIISGYEDGTFRPAENINFAEASKIVVNAFGFDPSGIGSNDPWYRAFVEPLASANAIPTSISDLDKSIARGEMSEVIYRIKDGQRDKESLKYYDLESVPVSGESCAVLKDYFENSQKQIYNQGMVEDVAVMAPTASESVSDSSSKSASNDFSSTNIQVAGVDEADFVKNDGQYIYVVSDGAIRIIDAYPADSMKEVVRFDMSEKNMTPTEMFLHDNKLIIIGNSWTATDVYPLSADMTREFWYPGFHSNRTVVEIYDVTNIEVPTLKRKLEFDGDYSESRTVGDTMYMIMNKYNNVYTYGAVQEDIASEALLPRYNDSTVSGDDGYLAGCGDIMYFPRMRDMNYVIAVAIPLTTNASITSEVMLGSSENVYSSTDSLYIAATNYDSENTFYFDSNNAKTVVYRYSLAPGSIKYESRGKVPGTILNQFSMDENKGFLRIATTTGNLFGIAENVSKNNLYVLNKDMNIVGSVEDIAPGEKIYSTRFLGNRGYMVTFKKTDPLFAFDLSDPRNPKILGKLKIPGYSDYIHPYDENHIIGFGKEAVDAEEDLVLQRNLDFAWYQGMKIALFDVTDIANPRQMFSEVIGDRGTQSELLYNHKALLFDKSKNLLAFPIQVAEINRDNCIDLNDCVMPANTYGETVFDGAYVYSLNLEHGFQLRGKISHYSPADEAFLKQGDTWYSDYLKQIHRLLYIGNTIYTVADGGIKASDMNTTEEKGFIQLQTELNYTDTTY